MGEDGGGVEVFSTIDEPTASTSAFFAGRRRRNSIFALNETLPVSGPAPNSPRDLK